MTVARLVKQTAMPAHPRIPGWREMVVADIPQVARLLRRYLSRFDVAPTFIDEAEVQHWFLSGLGKGDPINGRRDEQVVWAYVVEVRSVLEWLAHGNC
jgi:glycylpeptide N-tetradecanoyltransferase